MKEKLHYDDKGSTFKEAFAEARKEGKKTFEWNGEKYTTALKSEKKAETPSTRDIGSSPRIDDMYTVRNLAAKASRDADERRDIVSKQEQAKAASRLETDTGRAMLDKELPRMAKRVKDVSDTAKGYEKEFQARDKMARDAVSSKKKGGAIKAYASGGTTTSKPEPKKDTMPEWAKNERENRRRDELNKREAEGAAKEVKRNMSTFGFKNGGSASSRADGIAQRGKTRGKIV